MSQKITKIQTTTLTQQIVDLLKQRILNNELLSGQRIWAADLAEELGVSMIPVKDALLILQGEGLIITVPRRGSIVRQFSLKDVHELVHIRLMIETDAAVSAIKNGAVTSATIDRLTEHNEAIGQYRTDEGGFSERSVPYQHDRLFHDVLVDSCGNKLLLEWYNRMNLQAQIIRLAFWNIGLRGDKTYNEHKTIIDGMADQNLTKIRKAIKAHLDSIIADFNRAVKEEGLKLTPDGELPLPHGRRHLRHANERPVSET